MLAMAPLSFQRKRDGGVRRWSLFFRAKPESCHAAAFVREMVSRTVAPRPKNPSATQGDREARPPPRRPLRTRNCGCPRWRTSRLPAHRIPRSTAAPRIQTAAAAASTRSAKRPSTNHALALAAKRTREAKNGRAPRRRRAHLLSTQRPRRANLRRRNQTLLHNQTRSRPMRIPRRPVVPQRRRLRRRLLGTGR